jgi:hypothetical protein
LSTTTDTEFIGEDPTANVDVPVVDPDTTPDQHDHDHGEDDEGNRIACADSGCIERPLVP